MGNELFNCPPYAFVIVLIHSSGKKPFINSGKKPFISRLNVVKEAKELSPTHWNCSSKLEKSASQSVTADMFIGTVRKYTRAKKLTQPMLNELIQKIEVFNAEKVEGVWQQRLIIHYNCVGSIEIPEVLTLPAPEVSVNTRKGVTVSYASETATA